MLDLDAMVFTPHPVITDGTAVLDHNPYDVEAWDESLTRQPELAARVAQAQGDLVTAEGLLRDAYFSYFRPTVEGPPPAPLAPGYEANAQVLATWLGTDDHAATRRVGTVEDPVASTIATLAASTRLLRALSRADRAQINDAARLGQLLEELLAGAQDALAAAADCQDPQRAAGLAERALALHDAALDTLPAPVVLSDEAQDALREAARAGEADAQDAVRAYKAALEAFAGGQGQASGGPTSPADTLPAAARLALAQRVARTPALARIAALAGGKIRLALAVQARKTTFAQQTISGVTRGADLRHLLPGERALLAHPTTHRLATVKFAERQLGQYQLSGQAKLGRGPIICVRDESGSMAEDALDGQGPSDLWAKAIGLALLAIARHQRRQFCDIAFSHTGRLVITHLDPREDGTAKTLAIAEGFLGGGTEYEPWMAAALDIVTQHAYDRADVVLLTDGVCALSSTTVADWARARRERGMQCHSVLVGAQDPYGTLTAISDDVVELADFLADDDVTRTLFAI